MTKHKDTTLEAIARSEMADPTDDTEFRTRAISVLRRLLRIGFQIVIPADVAGEVRAMQPKPGPPPKPDPKPMALAQRKHRAKVAAEKKLQIREE